MSTNVLIESEIVKLHPEDGDVFILNLNTDDPEIIYSEEVSDSIDQLSSLLYNITGKDIPILVFGTELNLSIMNKDDILDLLDNATNISDNDKDDTNEFDEELTKHFK